jgi:hypothetical protein
VGKINWEWEIERLRRLYAEAEAAREISKAEQARRLIRDLLPRDGEWHKASLIYQAAEAEGISERDIKRQRLRLRVEFKKTETFPSESLWRWLPEPEEDAEAGEGESVPCVIPPPRRDPRPVRRRGYVDPDRPNVSTTQPEGWDPREQQGWLGRQF